MSASRPGSKPGHGRTIVLGLEHFIDKIGYQAAEYRRRGIDALYLVMDKSGLSQAKAREYDARVEVVPTRLRRRLAYTWRRFRSERPEVCELYDIGRLTLPYALMAKASGARLIMILRGRELTQDSAARLAGVHAALRLADHVVAKELNLVDGLRALRIPDEKVTFLGNCVPVPDAPSQAEPTRDIDVLFLNSVRRMRNVDLLVRALPTVLQRRRLGRIVIAGFTHLDQDSAYRMEVDTEHEVLSIIEALGLRERIEVTGFVPDPEEYYRRARIFVLPADIIFANYSLLEAMSHGVVPLVGDGEGAERIVRDGENGRVVARTPEAIAEGLLRLLGNDDELQRLALAARETIERDFSIRSWGDRILAVRQAVAR